jgi:two-component system sensor histidine kinase KdpD
VLIRVRDRGPGIVPADRERIFEPFERGSGEGRGSGLGLAIARGFAEANGGVIGVESSSEHGGSTFVLDLPAAAEHVAVVR